MFSVTKVTLACVTNRFRIHLLQVHRPLVQAHLSAIGAHCISLTITIISHKPSIISLDTMIRPLDISRDGLYLANVHFNTGPLISYAAKWPAQN